MRNKNNNGTFPALKLKSDAMLRAVPSLPWIQNFACSTTGLSLQGREVGSWLSLIGVTIVVV